MLVDLYDKTLVTPAKYVNYSFALCILVRSLLGFFAIQGMLPKSFLLCLSSIIIFIFINKPNTTWKAYHKTVIIWTVILAITMQKNIKWTAVGLLIMFDALSGLTTKNLFDKIVKYSN